MYKSDRIFNYSFKKIAFVVLLSLTPAALVMQVQADDKTKQSTESTVQSPIVDSININSANAEELADALKGVGLERAKAIVAWRQKNGQFKHIDDLLSVKGIGKKIVDANVEKINF